MFSKSLLTVFTFALIMCLCTEEVNSAKLLALFTIPAKSQYVLGKALMKGLAAKGHDVTLITAYGSKSNNVKNYREICVEELAKFKEETFKAFANPDLSFINKAMEFPSVLKRISELIIENKEVQELLKTNAKFDVTIHNMMFNEALLGLSHKFNASVIGYSSVGTNPWINYHTWNAAPYSYVPNLMLPFTDEMSLWQRAANTWISLIADFVLHIFVNTAQVNVMQKYFPEAPPLQELLDEVNLYFLNSHFSTEPPRPLLTNMIQIGGYHLQEAEDSPKDIQQFLDNSKNGVIFFSMGSNIRPTDLFPQSTLEALIVALSKTKFDVLWKFERNIENLPKHIKISDWVPQRAVLKHKNVKMFMTHNGLGSTVESVYHGVPMICIPMMGDQLNNAKDSVAKGYGVPLNYKTLTEKDVTDAIEEIARNPVYKKNLELRSDLYKNQEISPIDRANFWIEHVIRHKGAKHLQSKSITLRWYQYYLIDVLLVSSVVVASVLYLLYFISRFILRSICGLFSRDRQNKGTSSARKVKKN